MDNDNNIDFKDLWKKQSVSQPDMSDLLARVSKFKKAALRSLWMINILLLATSAFIIFIWIYYQPQFISTKIGIVLTILAMMIYVFVYNKLLNDYKNIDSTQTNQEYLQKLISIKKKQQFMQTKMMSFYFIFLTIGICLYMYEYASRMSVLGASLTYGITLLWMLFNWFYIRPKQVKKQQDKINGLIEKFEEVNHQLDA
jgi:4-amino-4-deoxy-L-arabinose transferase-like glycosyltransferase